MLGLALAHSGRGDAAPDALERARHLLAGVSLEWWVTMLPIRDRDRIAAMEEGIRLAGGG